MNSVGSVVVVESLGNAMDVVVFKSQLDMVLGTIESGYLSKNREFGSPEHLTALRAVAERAVELVHKIESADPDDCDSEIAGYPDEATR